MFENSTRQRNGDDFAADAEAMAAELERDPRFVPSAMWKAIALKNLAMLQADGIENFKRSVSQNYFNWVVGRSTNIYRHVRRQWLRRPTLTPLRTRLESNIELRFTDFTGSRKLSPRDRLEYQLLVAYMWDVMCREDRAGLRQLVSEPEIGNPIRATLEGRLISQDLAHSIIESNAIIGALDASCIRPRIAEIGAGSGRLAHVLSATSRSGPYCIFDIPPALCVSQWYLPRVLPHKKIFHFRPFDRFESIAAELAEADIAFFTANQITLFPKNYFHVVLSISTMPEMTHAQIDLYLDLFQFLSRQLIFLKQWKQWKNPYDGTDMRQDDYKLAPQWRVVVDRTDPIIPDFFNRVWRAQS